MADELRTEVEQVKEREDVKQALKQTTAAAEKDQPKAKTKDKLWLGTHCIVLIGLGVFYYLLQFRVFGFAARYIPYIQKLDKAAAVVVVLLAIAKVADVYLVGRVVNAASRYNLRRIAKLLLGLLLLFAVISIVFQNWYTTLVSIGLFSLVLVSQCKRR